MSLAARHRDLVSGRLGGLAGPCARLVLAAVEPAYGWVVRRRNLRFDQGQAAVVKVDAPVISVGNLTVGGTGKTPLVCWLAQWLLAEGRKVTLLSRGYGGRGGANDEALELAARLPGVPQIQNPDRVAGARQALAAEPNQVLLLDDAFQHRRLARDLDIVLLDALEPFGYGRLLPRGLLREPMEGLARAHVVGLSRGDAVSAERREEILRQVESLAPGALWIELAHLPRRLVSAHGESAELESLRGRKVAAFCGIGNPAGFRHTLSQCGVLLSELRELPDHAAYDERTLRELGLWLAGQENVAAVLCTRKDLVKIPRETIGGRPLWAVEVELEITRGERELEALLRGTCQRRIEAAGFS